MVDEANLKVSNTPTDGYFLSAQSGNTGGLTWATPPAGYADSDVDAHLLTSGVTLDATNDRVGIGTVSPSQKLHVEGAGNQFMLLNNSTTNDGFYFKAGTGASSIQTNGGSNVMNFFTGGSERMSINSSGAIGFGGANYGSSGQYLKSNGAGSPPSWINVSFYGYNASPTFYTINTNSYIYSCLLYTSPSPRDGLLSRMPSSA